MAARNTAAPVIIKRKKVIAGGGGHGGAWKVAYADFVTAMMAFFMLMWLLNATTEKQRKGIADYFSPTIPINRVSGGGDGAFGGESVFSEVQLAQVGTGASAQRPTAERQASGQAIAAETAALAEVQKTIDEALMGLGGESMLPDDVSRHIVTRVTDEGLIVEFFDLEGEPLFATDSAEPAPVTLAIAGMLARVFALVGNEVAIGGHVRSYPEMLRVNPEWALSTERAQVFRGLIEAEGLDRARVQRVAGYADRKLAVRNPAAVRNNRLEVILLRAGK
ncbi:MAG: chemotaxis protein MotB [Rhodobacteraceae bacterium]|nr:chemotaxis protein MotB [Paracoccaceae bacterium]